MLEIKILETNIIDGGVEVFARAFNLSGQVGFGKDGTVDIERFRFFNPPLLVPDINGDVSYSEFKEEDDESVTKIITKYREDPEEALLQALEDTIKTVGKTGDKIIAGKRGNTTSTFYPSFNALMANYDARPSTFLTKNAAATGNFPYNTNASQLLRIRIDSSNNCRDIRRFLCNFDTSALDGQTITSAVQSFYGTTADTENDSKLAAASSFVSLTEATPASDDAMVSTDYNNVDGEGTTAGDQITTAFNLGSDFDNWSEAGYNALTYNAAGLAYINKTGITITALRFIDDINATTPTFSAISGDSNAKVYLFSSFEAGTTKDPKLVVEHEAGGGGGVVNPALLNLGRL